MTDVPYSPNYHRNKRRPVPARARDALPCALCGLPVVNVRYEVHVHDGGGKLVTEEEAATMDPAADLGFHPVGPDCVRRHPELRPYLYERLAEADLDEGAQARRR